MEIWLDSCDIHAIKSACKFNIVYGVTTNPSILSKTKEDPKVIISALLEIQNGPVAVQVVAKESDAMIQQALALNAFSSRIIVKVPVTKEGLVAMTAISQEYVPVMATAVFHPHQALLAALAGADYVAPYLGRMYDVGIDAHAALKEMQTIYRHYNFKTKILAAAIKTSGQIMNCAEMGISAVTLKETLFEQFLCDDSHTKAALQTFEADWLLNQNPVGSLL